MRSYDIEIHQSNAFKFSNIEFISPFIDYVLKGNPNVSINRTSNNIGLARVDINDLYIMTLTEKYEQKIYNCHPV